MATILWAIKKLVTFRDGIIIGEPDLTHENSIHRTIVGSFEKQVNTGNALSMKSVAGFFFMKHEILMGIKKHAAQLVNVAKKQEFCGGEVRNIRVLVDSVYEDLDSNDKFIEQFTARLQVWLSILTAMIHKYILAIRGEIVYSKDFETFNITVKNLTIRNEDISFIIDKIDDSLLRGNYK
jgi:hypothetical protein